MANMKKKSPVYVEIKIKSSMDKLWNATQSPELHTKWDLRFSSITYLPEKENEPQHFTYKRALPFGREIEGWGISAGSNTGKNGESTSSLHFGTDDALSPIKEGRGYWKYIPEEDDISFITQYDYQVNFGKMGAFFDQFVFRPLIGWGTALSFDVLKKWLENGESPASQYTRFWMSWIIMFLFSFIWIYHGLVPKLIFKHPTELLMIDHLNPFSAESSYWIVLFIGFMEVILGLLWLFYRRKKVLYQLQMILFPILTVGSIIVQPAIMTHPFNPLTFNLSLFVLSIIGFYLVKDIPTATTCKRKR